MNFTVVKQTKRKVSCLYCRSKKVKCDGEQPCKRCVSKDCGDQCTYMKQRPLGRPPKNAVVNKLILSRTKQHSSANTCRDFIIESLAYSIPNGNKFLHNDKTKNLHYFIDTYFTDVFSTAVTQLALVRGNNTVAISTTDVKMYDLLETNTWTATELVNIYISKTSSLPLDEAHDYNAVASAVFQELAFKFFDEPPLEAPLVNPLIALPTHQAVRLIECFFCIHPNSTLLNKTLLLQAFWTDSVDPLLLCAIYGTTTYFSKMLEGKPVHLWEAVDHHQRNPFLDYAYFLLQKSSSAATLVKYQAIILLGLFEGIFGLPRRGMALQGLAYMVGGQLGVLDGSLLATEVSDVEAELLSYAFWTNFNSTIRGSLDVGQAAHFTKDIKTPPLPPPNIEKSLSYQLEKSSGNQRLFRSYFYLVEMFYVASVHSKFMNKFLMCFPEVKFNLTCNGHNVKSRPKIGYPMVDGLLARLTAVLDEFATFIQENRHEWTPQQLYTIETSWQLLDIHLVFIMDFVQPTEGSGYSNTVFDIFKPTFVSSNDARTMARVQLAIPKIYTMMDTLQLFMADPKNYNNNKALLPRSLIVSVLETATTVLCLQHRHHSNTQQQKNMLWDYLNQVSAVANNNMWINWSMIHAVRHKINYYKDQVAKMEASAGVDSTIFSKQHDSSLIPSPQIFSVDDDLALAAFLDPCSPWLAPMVNLLPLDKMLCDNIIYDNNNNHNISTITTTNATISNNTTATTATLDGSNNNPSDITSLPLFDSGDLTGIMATPSNSNNIILDQNFEFNNIPPSSSPFTATTCALTPTLTYANDAGGDSLLLSSSSSSSSFPSSMHPHYPQQQCQPLSPIPPLESNTTPFIQNFLFSDDSF